MQRKHIDWRRWLVFALQLCKINFHKVNIQTTRYIYPKLLFFCTDFQFIIPSFQPITAANTEQSQVIPKKCAATANNQTMMIGLSLVVIIVLISSSRLRCFLAYVHTQLKVNYALRQWMKKKEKPKIHMYWNCNG